jgi:proline racemase/trans-L-3-hydroxyproline dehydratase
MRVSQWINTVDTHTDGQSTRIITGNSPIPGKNMVEKLQFFKSNLDHIRTSLDE